MVVLEGENIIIRRLEREDVDQMQLWGQHTDPLFFNYNFPKLSKKEADEWFRSKTVRFQKKSFAIEDKLQRVVGYLSIRDIKWIKRESELGIVIDPDHINKGYGTEALSLFLIYYFGEMKMRSIKLRTARFNKRAIRCYQKCGFHIIAEREDEFEDPYNEIFYNPEYMDFRKLFHIIGGKRITTYLHMTLTKEDFCHQIHSLSTKKAVECE